MTEEKALIVSRQMEVAEQAIAPEEISSRVKTYMEAKTKKIEFGGVRYPEFDDLQFAASFFGWKVATESEPCTLSEIHGFKGKARVIDKNGIEVGQADSYCMANERNWSNKPLFQLASMAQTRAAAKALGNLLRPIFKMSGYETTPAEEMIDEQHRTIQPPKSKPVHSPNGGTYHVPEGPEEDNTENGLDNDFPPPTNLPETKAWGNPTKQITENQRKKLYATYKSKNITDEKMKQSIKLLFNVDHSKDLTNGQFSQLLQLIENGGIR